MKYDLSVLIPFYQVNNLNEGIWQGIRMQGKQVLIPFYQVNNLNVEEMREQCDCKVVGLNPFLSGQQSKPKHGR